MSDTILGPYTAGELPEPWEHTFTDYLDVPIDITGFTVKVTYRLDYGAQVTRTGLVSDGPAGKALYAWTAADLTTAGRVTGEMTVGNGTNARYARRFAMRIDSPQGGPLPNI